ncbi:MAG: relaxase/mobilization nuclease domain-containing protein [Pseudomonadota bacterium]
MILVGNQRGGAADLARHLMKDENEHVAVHELRGFVAEDLHGAFREAYAASLGTRCTQFLYSLSLNPPPGQCVSTEDFESAIVRAEDRLGLTGQPRAVVFHEKDGRRHCHAVWSRIDTEEMKAVPLPHTKRKLTALSRELYLEHGWDMPKGLRNPEERDPRSLSLEEWQQAKRAKRDPRQVKAAIQDSWSASDNAASLQSALRENGLRLAKGDRRGFVVVDREGEAYALSRWAGVKTKEVRARLGDDLRLPDIETAKADLARDGLAAVERLRRDEREKTAALRAEQAEERRAEIAKHRADRAAFEDWLAKRAAAEAVQRQARLRSGLGGLFDRLTGRRFAIQKRNEQEALEAFLRDRRERDALIFKQLEERRAYEQRREAELERKAERGWELRQDRDEMRETSKLAESFALSERHQRKLDFLRNRQATPTPRPRARGPDRER